MQSPLHSGYSRFTRGSTRFATIGAVIPCSSARTTARARSVSGLYLHVATCEKWGGERERERPRAPKRAQEWGAHEERGGETERHSVTGQLEQLLAARTLRCTAGMVMPWPCQRLVR